MVDIFALSVAHAALLIALIRLMPRRDLDSEGESVRLPRPGSGPGDA